jgi:hypothetical protein
MESLKSDRQLIYGIRYFLYLHNEFLNNPIVPVIGYKAFV